jgi:hypothetical protein
MKSWQALLGFEIIDVGKTRSGKPRRTLVTIVMVAHTAADAKLIAKANPRLKFIERTRKGQRR